MYFIDNSTQFHTKTHKSTQIYIQPANNSSFNLKNQPKTSRTEIDDEMILVNPPSSEKI